VGYKLMVAFLALRERPGHRSAESASRGLISSMDRQRPGVVAALRVVNLFVFLAVLVAGIGPILWLFKASLSPSQEIITRPFALFPSGHVQWENFRQAWVSAHLGANLVNTLIVVVGSWLGNLLISTTGAYVLSVLRPRWGNLLSIAVLATLFIPGIVSLVPLYVTILKLPPTGTNLLNSYWAVWLPASANAFNVLVIKRFFDAIPRELFEAAKIDGAGPVRILIHLVLPMSRPVLGVVSLLAIVASWKDYLWPLVVLQNPDKQPLSVALARLPQSQELNVQMAGMFIALVIPVALFLVFQRQFLRGVGMAGGVKG
jgi:multiple sugar transport system permease protein